MAIASVVQRGSSVVIINEDGKQTASLYVGDGVQGYTSNTVSIRMGSMIYIYDEKGNQKGSVGAD